MTALTSILVRDHAVPVRKIEEALERQVVSGGDLETALLELDAIAEDVLAAYRAATFGLLPATREEIMGASPDVVRLVPREVAEREGLVPLRTEARILVAATASPPTPEQDQKLGFFLGYDLVYRVVSPPRLALALAAHYGAPVDPRVARLGARLAERDPGAATYVAPPGPSVRPPPGPRSLSAPPLAASTTPAPADAVGPGIPPPGAESTVVDHEAPAMVAPAPPPPRPTGPVDGPAPAGDGPATAGPRDDYRALARRRGPLSYEEAVDLLRGAAHRDEVLAVLFAYARQFFDYVALFVVAEGALVGRDAKGPGASPEAVAGARIEPAHGSTLAAVVDSGAPACVDLDVQARDRAIVQLLGRSGRQPAALIPATVRRRAVVLVYGDQGGDPMVLPDLGRLLALLPRVSEAFEGLILRRKKGDGPGSTTAPPSAHPRADAPPAGSRLPPRPPPGPPRPAGPAPGRPGSARPAPAPAPPGPRTGHPRADSLVRRLGAADTEPAPPPRMSPLPPRSTGAPGTDPSPAPPPAVDPRPTLQPAPRPPSRRPGDDTASYSVRPGAPRPQRPAAVEPGPAAGGDTRRLPAVPTPGEPSVIVDMGAQVETLVERLVTSGPDDADLAVEPLLRVGEVALPAMVRRFPGPLWFHRDQPHRKLPRGRDVSALARALVAFEGAAVPYLPTPLADPRPDVRFYALLVASERIDTELLGALVPRLLDDDDGVRSLALRVLAPYQRFPDALGRALHPVRAEARAPRRGGDAAPRVRAVQALGALRDRRSLELLVSLLDDPASAESTHDALVSLTRHDLGRTASRWRAWAAEQKGRHRIEWLIDALLQDDEVLRAAAGDELQQLTQQYLGYHPKLPLRDRRVAADKYRAWWDREGRAAWGG